MFLCFLAASEALALIFTYSEFIRSSRIAMHFGAGGRCMNTGQVEGVGVRNLDLQKYLFDGEWFFFFFIGHEETYLLEC